MQHAGKSVRTCRQIEARANHGEDVIHCGLCVQWIRKSRWELHCSSHLTILDRDCGIVRTANFVLRPAMCPFCLGDASMTCAERLRGWNSTKGILAHILHKHTIYEDAWPLPCPHPRCDAAPRSLSDLETHFQQDHALISCRFLVKQEAQPTRKHSKSPETGKVSKHLRQTQSESRGLQKKNQTFEGENLFSGPHPKSTKQPKAVSFANSSPSQREYSVTGDVLATLEAEEASGVTLSESEAESLPSLSELSQRFSPKSKKTPSGYKSSKPDANTQRGTAEQKVPGNGLVDPKPPVDSYTSLKLLKSASQIQSEQEATWKQRGYPKIKWEKVAKRVRELKSWLETCITAKSFPPFREQYAKKLSRLPHSRRRGLQNPLLFVNFGGYYGARGEAVV